MASVKKFLNYIGWDFKNVNGTFGIEIETETKSSSDYPDGFFKEDTSTGVLRWRVPMNAWEGHSDNSLRNFGMEFVLKTPLIYSEAMAALDDFKSGTDGIKFIKNSPSTSVHVHVNMLPEEVMTMMNFLTVYSLFENVLVDFSGETRRSNLFALPIRVAGQTETNIIGLIKMFKTFNSHSVNLDPNSIKYAALNLATLTRIGSLEIRSFRGETDVSEIKTWLTIVNKLLEFSRKKSLNPRIILFEYRAKGITLFDEIFQEVAEKIASRVNDIRLLIDRNLFTAYQIATSIKDWDSVSLPEKKKPEKKMPSFGGLEQLIPTDTLASASNIPPPPPIENPYWASLNEDDEDNGDEGEGLL